MSLFDTLLISRWPSGRFKRLPKTDINILRTRIWYQAVQHSLGEHSAYAVEVRLSADLIRRVDGKINRPRKWDKYRDGKMIPDIINTAKSSIVRAEAQAPGTAKWFFSPIWCALAGAQISVPDLDLYLRANPKIISSAYKLEPSVGVLLPKLDYKKIAHLKGLSGLDLLEFIVILLAMGQISKSQTLTKISLDLYVSTTKDILKIPELSTAYRDFLNAIEDQYFPRTTAPTEDIIAPWDVRLPGIDEDYYMRMRDQMFGEEGQD
jgi:hypothetical protein